MRRINGWLAVGAIGLAACGKDSGPTSAPQGGFDPAAVRANLAVIEQVHREPYDGAEYPTRRCYLVAQAA